MAYFAAGYLLFQILTFAVLRLGKAKMTRLPSVPEPIAWPSIAIIVPARNEAVTIEAGLSSLMRLDYPNLKIFVVNDRSTDATGEILARMAAQDSRVVPITVHHLPPDWLGKNHAIHLAVSRTDAELVLFTDADVVFAPDFLKRTVSLLQRNRLDHVTALPALVASDPLLLPVLGAFFLSFTLFVQPWKNKDPRSKAALGVGAFNLLRRESYLAIGGHEPIRMRPDDDLALGRRLKQSQMRTDCVDGTDGLRVEWYPSVWELARGLEKNAFSAFHYSLLGALVGTLLNPFFFLLPFALPFWVTGTLAQSLATAALAVFLFHYAYQLRAARLPIWCVPFLPLAGAFMSFVFVRAVALTFWRGGIYWRGTFYPLRALKKYR